MTQLIDRRLNGRHKSAVNRQRFIKRYRAQIKQAADAAIQGKSITDIASSEKINIPRRDLSEPRFHHAPGGVSERIYPGNEEFVVGDSIPRPPPGGGGGGGSQASEDGEGEDEFSFELTREEFLEFFFEDLELPNLVKTDLAEVTEFKQVHAGFSTDGVPANINIVRSLKTAYARRIAMQSEFKRRLHEIEALLEGEGSPDSSTADLIQEAEDLRARIAKVPYLDTYDLRFNRREKQPIPSTNAVMFCIMDVSGSMDEQRKDIAKRFFALLYLFLRRNYEKIDVVFIRHHTKAMEVSEEDFFYARETGGTIVSSALELMRDIVAERYPRNMWNIYAAQASDGDNWGEDSGKCAQLLTEHVLTQVRYFAYIEIQAEYHQTLWDAYATVGESNPNFAMRSIASHRDIYPVFRQLMQKKVS